MSEQSMEITTTENWKPKAMIIGGIIGAAVGMTAAYLLAQRGEEESPPEISVGDGIKLGVLVFGMLRSISNL